MRQGKSGKRRGHGNQMAGNNVVGTRAGSMGSLDEFVRCGAKTREDERLMGSVRGEGNNEHERALTDGGDEEFFAVQGDTSAWCYLGPIAARPQLWDARGGAGELEPNARRPERPNQRASA